MHRHGPSPAIDLPKGEQPAVPIGLNFGRLMELAEPHPGFTSPEWGQRQFPSLKNELLHSPGANAFFEETYILEMS